MEPLFDQNKLVKINEAAKILGVTKQTLRNWEKAGRLKSTKTMGGHRRYSIGDLNEVRKLQMANEQILLHKVTLEYLQKNVLAHLAAGFKTDEEINITITKDDLMEKVRIVVESADGLRSNTYSFRMDREDDHEEDEE